MIVFSQVWSGPIQWVCLGQPQVEWVKCSVGVRSLLCSVATAIPMKKLGSSVFEFSLLKMSLGSVQSASG
jgi:hypothetical protein